MICLECGKNFINLGVHVNRKHMSCDEYRLKHDIPLSTPLAEKELCDALSVSALQRLEDPDWLAECKARCEQNKGQRKSVPLPAVSKKHLIDMNRETGECYRGKMVPAILDDWNAGMGAKAIQRRHGVAPMTMRDWMRAGLLPSRSKKYVFEG